MTPEGARIRDEENRTYLLQAFTELTERGYRCYITKEQENAFPSHRFFSCGYVITPSGIIILIQLDYFGGWNYTFLYLRTRENGCGCRCFDESVCEVSLEMIEAAELQGSLFAYRLKAERYSSPEAWLRGYWEADNLQLIGAEAA